MNKNIALFLFDFDETIVKKHSHNYIGERAWSIVKTLMIGRRFESHNERDQEILDLTKQISINLMQEFLANEKLNWKNKEKIQDLMKEILASGHKIAIVSFNNYPYAVKYAIEQLIGKDVAKDVYIKSGLPATDSIEIKKFNKIPYIKEVMENMGIIDKKKVFFMDDDPKHVNAAKDFGIQAVLVEKEGKEYIKTAWKFFEEFNEIYGNYCDLKETPCSGFEADGIIFDPIDKDWANDGSKVLGMIQD